MRQFRLHGNREGNESIKEDIETLGCKTHNKGLLDQSYDQEMEATAIQQMSKMQKSGNNNQHPITCRKWIQSLDNPVETMVQIYTDPHRYKPSSRNSCTNGG